MTLTTHLNIFTGMFSDHGDKKEEKNVEGGKQTDRKTERQIDALIDIQIEKL
jgi:hypothetical protein